MSYIVILSTLSLTSPPFTGIIAEGLDYSTASKVILGAVMSPTESIKGLAPYKVQIVERKA